MSSGSSLSYTPSTLLPCPDSVVCPEHDCSSCSSPSCNSSFPIATCLPTANASPSVVIFHNSCAPVRSLKLVLLELGCNEILCVPYQYQTTLQELRVVALKCIKQQYPEHFADVEPEVLVFKQRYGFKRTADCDGRLCIGEFFNVIGDQTLELIVQIQHKSVNEGQEIGLFVGTWNMGNTPPPEDISAWIPLQQDVYAVGIQESKYANADRWGDAVIEHLGEDYSLVAKIYLMSIGLHLFARSTLLPVISEVTTTSKATGIGNMLGNKGGVCVSLKINDTRLCFVNCHLAAHQDKKERRNKDVESIMQMHIRGHMDLCTSFDFLFWMGDLNYRINFSEYLCAVDPRTPSKEAYDDVLRLIHGGSMHLLLEKDQLTTERLADRLFYGFEEKEIDFRPTFKVRPGVRLEYNAQRQPAWCDRVLWKTAPNKTLRAPYVYQSAETILTSDHKPVLALFLLPPSISPSPVNSAFGPCILKFLELRCKGLSTVPKAFSYVKFSGEMLEHVAYSSALQGSSPVWLHGLPSLDLLWNNPDRLRCEHVDLKIADEGTRSAIGYARIPLSGIAVHPISRPMLLPFECPVALGGLPAGFISGVLEFKLTERTKAHKTVVVPAVRHSITPSTPIKMDPSLLRKITEKFLEPGEMVEFYCNNSQRPRVMVIDEAVHFVVLTDKRILCVKNGRVEMDLCYPSIVKAFADKKTLFGTRLAVLDSVGTISSVGVYDGSLVEFLLQRLNGVVTIHTEGGSIVSSDEEVGLPPVLTEAKHCFSDPTLPSPSAHTPLLDDRKVSDLMAEGASENASSDFDPEDPPTRPRTHTLPCDERLWSLMRGVQSE